jgi:hypothetical protein
MREFVGVSYSLDWPNTASLKREAMMFQRLAVPHLKLLISGIADDDLEIVRELAWLFENGIVFDPQRTLDDERVLSIKEYEEYYDVAIKPLKLYRRLPLSMKSKFSVVDLLQRARKGNSWEDIFSRYVSAALREVENMDAYPILRSSLHSVKGHQASKRDVVQIVLNELPTPDDSTPWEQVIEYRSDPDSRSKFFALRNWINKVVKANNSPTEIEEELEYLLDQYQQHMKLHRLKHHSGTLETIVIIGAEVVENLVKVRWGKIAQVLFSLKQRRIALLEAELTSPGREVAYIFKSKEIFHP